MLSHYADPTPGGFRLLSWRNVFISGKYQKEFIILLSQDDEDESQQMKRDETTFPGWIS